MPDKRRSCAVMQTKVLFLSSCKPRSSSLNGRRAPFSPSPILAPPYTSVSSRSRHAGMVVLPRSRCRENAPARSTALPIITVSWLSLRFAVCSSRFAIVLRGLSRVCQYTFIHGNDSNGTRHRCVSCVAGAEDANRPYGVATVTHADSHLEHTS